MPTPFVSALIRYRRLERNWSQEGLCDGVCAVSYLSKIEQGKAEASPEILQKLLKRLEIAWHADPEAQQTAAVWKEALFSLRQGEVQQCRKVFAQNRERWLSGPWMLDLLLLEKLCRSHEAQTLPLAAFEDCLDETQRALWLLGEGRCEEALKLLPISYVWLECGTHAYAAGSYAQAIEYLLKAEMLAVAEGRARVMLWCRVTLGNCYSNLLDEKSMLRHYQAAERLAQDLDERDILEGLRYNQASTQMTMGRCEQAYAYFANLENPCNIALHKLAICLEKQGRVQEALEVLDRVRAENSDYAESYADDPPHEWVEKLCALVRYRLEHPAYLRDPAYGEQLLSLFRQMQDQLPHGFALFHLPWVEEWYIANRQYKQAYELKNAFSSK